MASSVICISHTDGSDGPAVGRLVAARLGFAYVDDGIVAQAASVAGLYPESVAQAEAAGAGRRLEVDFGRFESSETLRRLIREAIVQTAGEGSVVIVAHAASHALAGRGDVLRVLVTASPETRAARIVGGPESLDAKHAAKRVAESDRGRATYLRRFYDVKSESSTDYDLVVNTDTLTPEAAAAIVLAAAS